MLVAVERLPLLFIVSLIGCGAPSTGHHPTAPTVAGAPATSESSGAAPANPADQACVSELTLAPEMRFPKPRGERPDAENGAIAIAVGETLCLDAREAGGKLVDFRMMSASPVKARAMKVQLTYRGDVGYTMTISNPRLRTMRYRAKLLIHRQNGVAEEETSTFPVMPGILTLENWPGPAGALAGIVLDHFEVPASAP